MNFIWILVAFACGYACRLISLPPLIGFLAAGFLLNALEFEPDASLQILADLGITLLLFTVGLKLNIKQLLKTEVWAGTGTTMLFWIAIFTGFSVAYIALGLSYFSYLTWQTAALLGFGLSFSSTVCIVKILEDGGEMKTRHGNLAIGILVMQDILAVVFLVFATGKIPTVYAIGLLGLPLLRPLLGKLLNSAGHGELLPLLGFFLALGGYELFYLLGVKGDLGALAIGILISNHSKASELAKSLLSFKDLFLIGFFLSIGFVALPTIEMLTMALFLGLLLPFKFLYSFWIFNKLKLKGRTSFLSSLALANYSEFGLIVVSLSVANGWLHQDWLVILAIAVSISFIITSVLYRIAHSLYRKNKSKICAIESPYRLPDDIYQQPENAEILVVGMGRVGVGSYDALCRLNSSVVWGIDADRDRANRHIKKGRQVICADGEDIDFWESIELYKIQLVMLALPSTEDVTNIVEQLKAAGYQGRIAAIARFEDDRKRLESFGIDKVFNFYTEAGQGFAEESVCIINQTNSSNPAI